MKDLYGRITSFNPIYAVGCSRVYYKITTEIDGKYVSMTEDDIRMIAIFFMISLVRNDYKK